jgi:hypothetical protein
MTESFTAAKVATASPATPKIVIIFFIFDFSLNRYVSTITLPS